jgi:membrane protease YdiL (CAAX protease family)
MSGAAPQRWGLWGSILWTAAVMMVFVATQTIFASLYVAATRGKLPPERMSQELEKLATNGDVVAVAAFLSTPACLLALFILVKLKRGATLEDSLALRVPEGRTLLRWLAAVIVFSLASDALTWILGKPIVPEFMRAVYGSAESKAALGFALILAGPIFEETLFRGFLVTGLVASRLGGSGAIIISSLAWALIHQQYDAYGIATIFALGILLGAARVKSNSLLVPIAMHVLMNSIATLEAALL